MKVYPLSVFTRVGKMLTAPKAMFQWFEGTVPSEIFVKSEATGVVVGFSKDGERYVPDIPLKNVEELKVI